MKSSDSFDLSSRNVLAFRRNRSLFQTIKNLVAILFCLKKTKGISNFIHHRYSVRLARPRRARRHGRSGCAIRRSRRNGMP
jgi:hypothetical protein